MKRNKLNLHFPLLNWITLLGNNIRTYERGQHGRYIPVSCSVLFKLRNRFKNMIETIDLCTLQFSRNKPYLLVRFFCTPYLIGLDQVLMK